MFGFRPSNKKASNSLSDERSRVFEDRKHERDRYWWHNMPGNKYVPAIYRSLSVEEWDVIAAWYRDSEERKFVGEMCIPMISVLQGFIEGSGIRHVVQCGHYAGYSAMLLGFMFRRMRQVGGLYSIDIDPQSTEYARQWIERAGLSSHVQLVLGNSADSEAPNRAREYFQGEVDCVIIDTSHEYEHTLTELDLWYPALRPLGLLFLHDTSRFAIQYDTSGKGGVQRAFREWVAARGAPALNLNEDLSADQLRVGKNGVYLDPNGLGIIQKPMAVE
jgi:predicted O-methyltransferase YrrM